MTIVIRPFIIACAFLFLWSSMILLFDLPDYILPAPSQVFTNLHSSLFLIGKEAIPTLIETLLGLFLGILLGCIAGLIIAFFRPLAMWLLPILVVSQAIPTFVIAPLLVIWLGYGMASKIAITTLMLFFPIMSSFYDGLSKTDRGLLDLAKTMNAKPWQTFWRIRIPAALPSLASGIRIAAVMAPIGAIVGEWVGSSQGLGYLMLNANARMQIDMMFSVLITIMIFALLLYYCVNQFLKWIIYWD